MTFDDDPGWPLSPMLLVPGLGVRLAQRRAAGDGLVLLRLVFVMFVFALVMFGVVLLFVDLSEGSSVGLFAAVVVADGTGSTIVASMHRRPLDCSSEAALADSYRTRFFLRIALAESAALLGFVGVFLTGARWLYLLAVMFTAVGFARAAPTRRALQREGDELAMLGCGRSLVAALRQSPGPRASR